MFVELRANVLDVVVDRGERKARERRNFTSMIAMKEVQEKLASTLGTNFAPHEIVAYT